MPITLLNNQNQTSSLLDVPILPAAVAAGGIVATKELEEERRKNEEEIKRAETNLATIQIPSDLADIGLTRQDLLSELHQATPGVKAAGTTTSAELRRAYIDRDTILRVAAQKGLNVNALRKAMEKKDSEDTPQKNPQLRSA